MDNRDKIIKLIGDLIDVESSPEEETAIFRTVKHEELISAMAYWFDQSKMVFGEVMQIEQTQSLRDSGVDLSLSLIQSKIKFGIQIKSFGDIEKKDFSTKLKAQTFESDSHNLEKYIILFAGDLNTQKEKIRGMISELSQRNKDMRILTVSPEKVLTILNAYRNKVHPMKLLLLELTTASRILNAIVDNLNNEKREVSINIGVKYLHKDSTQSTKNFKMNYSVDKKEIEKVRIQDDIEHIGVSDEVVRITKDNYKDLAVSDEKEDTHPDEILIYNTKPNRIFMELQALSNDGKLIRQYGQLVDVTNKENVIYYAAKDTKKPLQFSIKLDVKKGSCNFEFNEKYKNYSINDLYEMVLFVAAVRNASYLRLTVVDDNVSQVIPVTESIDIDSNEIAVDIITKLKIVQDRLATDFKLQFASISELKKLHSNLIGIVHVLTTNRLSPKYVDSVSLKFPREMALQILKDYKDNKIEGKFILVNYPISIVNHNSTIQNVRLHMKEFFPVTKIEDIEKEHCVECDVILKPKDIPS